METPATPSPAALATLIAVALARLDARGGSANYAREAHTRGLNLAALMSAGLVARVSPAGRRVLGETYDALAVLLDQKEPDRA